MNKRLILLPLLLLAASAQAAITATLLDDDGKPLAGVRVRAFAREDQRAFRVRLLSSKPESEPISTATSGDDGRVTIDPKSNAVVRLVADAAKRAVLVVDAVDGEDAGAFVLPVAAPRKGRVVSGGKPVAGAVVAIAQWYVTKSDGQGNFDVPQLVSGFERVLVVHPDYAIGEAALTAAGDTLRHSLEVTLTKGTAISGRVTGRDDKPVAHATVTVGGWPLAESRDDGTFAVAHAPNNWRVVFATTPELAGAAMKTKTAAVDIKLAPAQSVGGSVTSSSGAVAGAYVTLVNELDPGAQPATVTDAKGQFTVGGLVPGRYAIVGTHPAFSINRTPLDVPQSSRSALVIAAEGLAKVRGRVIDEERKPVAGARIMIAGGTGYIGGSTTPAVATNAAGEFSTRVRETSNGVQIVAAHRNYAAAVAGPFSLERAKDINITLQKGFAMQLRVVDSQRQPVPRASIEISRGGEGLGLRMPLPCPTPSDECRLTKNDGTFEIRLVEGKHNIIVSGDDLAPKRLMNQELTARSSPMTVTVDRGVEVSGRVVFGDGTPAGGAVVTARMPFSRTTTAAADGSFTLRGLPPGNLSVTAATAERAPAMQSLPVAINAPAKGVELRIPTPATITGRVVDKGTSQPITDFQIMPTSSDLGAGMGPGNGPAQFHTIDGTFSMEVVPGHYQLRAMAQGYVGATLNGIAVEEGKSASAGDFKLERGGRIVGRVTASGKPVSGAAIFAVGERMGGPPATSDANGEFALDGVEKGEREIEARKEGYMPKRKSISAAAGSDTRADIELERGHDLTGRVIDRGGQPVERARVQARAGGGGPMARAVSDAEGYFKLEGLGDRRYNITVEREGYVGGGMSDVDPSTPNLIVTLDRGGTITGRVVGLGPAELQDVNVSAQYGTSGTSAQVNSDGTFTVTGVPDGVVTLRASKYGPSSRQSARKSVTVTNGVAPSVDLDFVEGISVRGRITRDGKPMTNGQISFSPLKSGSGESGNTMIGTDGMYQVAGLSTGEYRVFINFWGMNPATYSDKLTITGSMTKDFDLQGTTAHGRVVDSGGAPVADVALSLTPLEGEVRNSRRAVSDSDGRFLFELVQEGRYNLTAQRQQFATKQQDVAITAAPADIEVRLEGVQPTIVRVTDAATGAPVAASVVANDPKSRSVVSSTSARGEDGTAKLWLAPGNYVLHVAAADYATQNSDLVVPGADVQIALQKGSAIAFRMPDSASYMVRIKQDGKLIRTDAVSMPFRTTITGFAPGAYVVEVFDATGKNSRGTYPVTLVPGQTAAIDVK